MIMDPQALITKARSVRDKSLPTDALIDLDNLPLDVTSVPRTCGKLTSWELDITEQYDATALLGQLSTGAITAVNLLTAFQKRAAIAQQLVRHFPAPPNQLPK
jgi:amidase